MNRVQVFQRTAPSTGEIAIQCRDSPVYVNAYPLDSDLFNVIHPLSNSGQLIRNGNGKRTLREIHSPKSRHAKKPIGTKTKGKDKRNHETLPSKNRGFTGSIGPRPIHKL